MIKVSGKPTEIKNVNTSLILDSIKTRGNATRGEIVKDTNLSHTTVRAILNELIALEEIVSIGLDKSSGGRRAERYKINSNKRCLLALSIEENIIVYRVVNILGEALLEGREKINSLEDTDIVINLIEDLCKANTSIKGIGISVPGVVTNDGYISGIRMDEWKEIKITKEIEKNFDIPIIVENDLNSAALAFYNKYIEENNFISISLVHINFSSLGVGAGIIVNGNIVKGDNGYAGEIGFMPIENTPLNVKMLDEIDNNEYCNIIINIIKTIAAIINPSLVVLGGSSFKYNLKNEIINRYNKEFKIKTEIVVQENNDNYSLEGIKEMALGLINKEVKIIKS